MWFGNKTEYNMKIGILTQPLKNNYGGLLQNYALQLMLQRMGHEPVTIDWDDAAFLYEYKAPIWKKKILPFYLKWVRFTLRIRGKHVPYTATAKEEEAIGKNNRWFISRFIFSTPKAINSKELRAMAMKYDCEALVVGSDQVWRPRYNEEALCQMFFEFAKGMNLKRIAYAASFGTSDWEFTKQQMAQCRQLAQDFDAISVREESGVDICEKYLSVEAQHVLDPTMLLDKEDYLKVIDTAQKDNTQESVSHEGQLLIYLLDPTAQQKEAIIGISNTMNKNCFTVMPKYNKKQRTKDDVKKRIEDCVFLGPIEWLKGFRDADMVFCDSFHGCVFSIIFNKPFWVFANEDRGLERFTSLLKLFGLENRLVFERNLNVVDFNNPINWDNVNEIRKEWQKKSLNYLKDAGL